MSDTNNNTDNKSQLQAEQAAEAPKASGGACGCGAKINYTKIGISLVIAGFIFLMMWFAHDCLLVWGATRHVFGSGFWNSLVYGIELYSALLLMFISMIATLVLSLVAVSQSGGPKAAGGGFLALVPHCINVLVILTLGGLGCYAVWHLFQFGGALWWTGVCSTINALFTFMFALFTGLGFIGAFAVSVLLAVKSRR